MADTDWFKHMEECEQEDAEPSKKKPCSKGTERSIVKDSIDGKLDDALKTIESIDCKMCVFDELRRGYECCICKLPCLIPTLSPCCGHIVECCSIVRQTSDYR